MGVKATPITTEWDGILTGLIGKNMDVIIGSIAITPDREKRVNFTRSYYYDGAQLFVKEESNIESIGQYEVNNKGVP